MHDKAFVPVGEKTGICYEDDYDHYLSLLLKGNNWAINVITFYNQAVFGESQVDQPTPSLADLPTTNWEDEFLRKLDEEPLSVSNNPVGTSSETPLDDMASGSYLEPLTSVSGTLDIHEGLDQLFLDGESVPSASALGQHHAPSSHRVTPIAAIPAQPQTSSAPISAAPTVPTQPQTTSAVPNQSEMVVAPVEPMPAKHVTHESGRTTRAKK